MPHLDFREALSTPEEKVFSPASPVAAVMAEPVLDSRVTDFLRGLRLSRSTLVNIVFVAIASVGGLVCAFYFFNGSELLRAAASWPAEYLYPRPLFGGETVAGKEQPNPVDQFGAMANDSASGSPDEARTVSQPNTAPGEFLPVGSTGGTPASAVVTGPPPVVILPPPSSVFDQITSDLNTTVAGADAFVQSLLQNPAGAASSTLTAATGTVKKSAQKRTTATRRKIGQQKSATAGTNSSVKNLQPATNQTPTGMTTVRPVNQMMSGGGLGGPGSIGAIGGGVGAAGGGVGAGPIGGAAGGLGGLNGGGLGGTISGVGGTVGGLIGGKH